MARNADVEGMHLPGTQRVLLRVCWYGAAVLLAAFVLQAATGLGGDGVATLFQDYVYNALLLAGAGFCLWRAAAFREERLAWLVMGAGIVAWTGADVLWTVVYANHASPPYPSVADGLWLLYYPAACVTLLLLVRARVGKIRLNLLFDGLIAALTVAALCCAVLYGPVVHASAGDLSPEVLTNLAYPLGDLLLLGLVVAILGLTGWRPGRGWILLASASRSPPCRRRLPAPDGGGPMSRARCSRPWPPPRSWWGSPRGSRPNGRRRPPREPPDGAGAVRARPDGVGLLSYDHFDRLNGHRDPRLGRAPARGGADRPAVLREPAHDLANPRRGAHRPADRPAQPAQPDDDMSAELALATPEEPRAIVLFDLDGFKEYNDTFGHPAGDGLLVRLGCGSRTPYGARPRLPPRATSSPCCCGPARAAWSR